MIGLLQRVSEASVRVEGRVVAAIQTGLLILVGVERDDTETEADRLCDRIINYRVFADDQGRMNLSVADIRGGILLVPQFTLAADTRKGTRASFTSAATPEVAQRLFDYLFSRLQLRHENVAKGVFGADMQVALINDGPVTFSLHVRGV